MTRPTCRACEPYDPCGWPKCSCEDNPDPLSAAKGVLMIPGACIVALVVIAGVAALLSGCETVGPKEPGLVTVGVNMPVAASCIPDGLDKAPPYKTWVPQLKAAPDAATRLQLAGSFVLAAVARLGETEPLIDGCAKAPTLTGPSR